MIYSRKPQLYNLADDNTICRSADDFLITLRNASDLSVKQFRENNTIDNPDKFQTMVLQKQDKNSQTNSLNIDNKKFAKAKSVKLLDITMDGQLRLTA